MSPDIREFYELYNVHRDALAGVLSDDGPVAPKSADDICERNLAALELTFLVGEALAGLDAESNP